MYMKTYIYAHIYIYILMYIYIYIYSNPACRLIYPSKRKWEKLVRSFCVTLRINLNINQRLVGWDLWHCGLCRLFNANSIFIQIIDFISNIYISSYSVYSNRSHPAHSVQHRYRFCLHTVNCQNSSTLNNSV